MGETKRRPGYVTDILTDMAAEFLEARRGGDRPFLLMLHHKAPHRNWQPAERHLRLYDDAEFPEPPTLFDDYATRSRAAFEQEMTIRDHMTLESDLKLGPPPARMDAAQREAWERAYGPKREAFRRAAPTGAALVRWKYRRYLQDYLGCIAAVDESVGRVLEVLDRTGLAETTLVVYTSDQGFFLGEHGWFDKRFMYEEALRMPLVMRFPGRIRPGSVNTRHALEPRFRPHVPGCLRAAASPPRCRAGRSCPCSWAGPWRDGPSPSTTITTSTRPCTWPSATTACGRGGTSSFISINDIDAWELYDLEKDPMELRNVFDDPAYARVRRELENELARLRAFYQGQGLTWTSGFCRRSSSSWRLRC